MMNQRFYINGIGILSPQRTYDNNIFLPEMVAYRENVLTTILPDFKEYINPIQLRRLSRMLRIGLAAAIICTRDSGNKSPDGIITGTGYGFLNDTAKFVSEMLQQNERHLTPTFFMQGTYNALSGLVALTLRCNGYNNTYVNKGFSFETCLHDGMLHLMEGDLKSLLIGGYDEADSVQYKVNARVDHYKQEFINSLELFDHKSRGSLQGEGAAFFALEATRGENCWCMIRGVKMIFMPASTDMLLSELKDFVKDHQIRMTDIDVFVNGVSGDGETDKMSLSIAQLVFSAIPEIRFKHLCGEYCTASSFGLWVGASILKRQEIPEGLQFNKAIIPPEFKYALMINQYMGRNYSFILLER